MKRQRSGQVAIIAIFIALFFIVNYFSTILYGLFPLPVKPTLLPILVILASVCYGPRLGSFMGLFMGLFSVVNNTIAQTPMSYLFSPFVQHGNFLSLVVAIVPRVLIGLIPYFIYKGLKNRTGLFLAGVAGALTNTIFVFLGIFVFFSQVYGDNIMALLASISLSNSIAEMIIDGILVAAIAPRLLKS